MVDNQHEKIKGYRDLSKEEIASMNEVKEIAEQVADLVRDLSVAEDTDKRWVNIGKTHLQQGFMALARSVAKPESF
jgi:hypothetical protein